MIVQAQSRQTPAAFAFFMVVSALLVTMRVVLTPGAYYLMWSGVPVQLPGMAAGFLLWLIIAIAALRWNNNLCNQGIQPRDMVAALLTVSAYLLVPATLNLNQLLAGVLMGSTLSSLIQLQEGTGQRATRMLFETGIAMGIAALLAPETLLFVPLVAIALLIYGFYHLRFFAVVALGVAWVVGLRWAANWLFPQWLYQPPLTATEWGSWALTPPEWTWMALAVWGISLIFVSLQRLSKGPRKALGLSGWTLFLATCAGIVFHKITPLAWLCAAPCMGLLLSTRIRRIRKPWIQDLVFGILWGLTILAFSGA
jgi:hypothetical protein